MAIWDGRSKSTRPDSQIVLNCALFPISTPKWRRLGWQKLKFREDDPSKIDLTRCGCLFVDSFVQKINCWRIVFAECSAFGSRRWIQCRFQHQNDATWVSKNGHFARTILQKAILLGLGVCLRIIFSKSQFLKDCPSKMFGFGRAKVDPMPISTPKWCHLGKQKWPFR